jgi:hypothetical protein
MLAVWPIMSFPAFKKGGARTDAPRGIFEYFHYAGAAEFGIAATVDISAPASSSASGRIHRGLGWMVGSRVRSACAIILVLWRIDERIEDGDCGQVLRPHRSSILFSSLDCYSQRGASLSITPLLSIDLKIAVIENAFNVDFGRRRP